MSVFIIYDYKAKEASNEDSFLAARRVARAVEARYATIKNRFSTTIAVGVAGILVGLLMYPATTNQVLLLCVIACLVLGTPFAVHFSRKYRGLYAFARARREGGFISIAEKGGERVLLYGQTLGALRSACDTRATGYALVGETVRIDAGESNPDGIMNSTRTYGVSYQSYTLPMIGHPTAPDDALVGFGWLVITVDGQAATGRLPLWTAMLLVNNGFHDPLQGFPWNQNLREQLYDRLSDAGLLESFGGGDFVQTMSSMYRHLLLALNILVNLSDEMRRVEKERTPLTLGGTTNSEILNLRDNAHVRKVVMLAIIYMHSRISAYGPIPPGLTNPHDVRMPMGGPQWELAVRHIIEKKTV